MRVLHCIPSMGPGGAERQLAYLAAELPKLGWRLDVALLAGGPNLARLHASGAAVHVLPAKGNYDPAIPWRVWRLVRRVKPGLVQTWLPQMDVFAGLAARAAGVPWILSERSSAAAYPPTLRTWARAVVASLASAMVANSTGGARYWTPRLPARVPLHVIPNAVPLDEIEAVRPAGAERTGLFPDERIVLFVGRFSPEKNVPALVESLHVVLRQPRTVAVLCGEGPGWADIEARLRDRGLTDRVRLPGFVGDVWAWMKRASVLVAPSLFEGHPNAVLEGAACGCPLVLSDVPAHRDFLDEDAACLVDPTDAEALTAAILGVLGDPEPAARRAKTARARVEQWTIKEIARRYDAVYRQVLRPPGIEASGA